MIDIKNNINFIKEILIMAKNKEMLAVALQAQKLLIVLEESQKYPAEQYQNPHQNNGSNNWSYEEICALIYILSLKKSRPTKDENQYLHAVQEIAIMAKNKEMLAVALQAQKLLIQLQKTFNQEILIYNEKSILKKQKNDLSYEEIRYLIKIFSIENSFPTRNSENSTKKKLKKK